jgi:uncharacterized protein
MAIRVIDADTHIDETEDTWAWLEEHEKQFIPQTDAPKELDPNRPPTRYWLIDGHRQPRPNRDDARTRTTLATRTLADPMERVRHMDEMGTEVQVLYPSLFLVGVTDNPDSEYALKRSYNRWLADRCQHTNGRIRWVCLPPFKDIQKSLEEIRFAKENGAVAILKKGDKEAGHWMNEEYYYPIYEECQKLDLAVCFHIGSGVPEFTPAREFPWGRFAKLGVPPMHGFHSIVMFGMGAKFPGIRWGFIETGASWVPWAVYDTLRRLGRERTEAAPGRYTYEKPSDVVTKNKCYITCQVDEDLPYIMQYATEDNLVVGSDYTHADASMEMDFPKLLQARADSGEIPQTAVKKILYDNAKALYGL